MPENVSLNQYLTDTRTKLDAALASEEILSLLGPLGYDAPAIQEIADAVADVETLSRAQQQEYAEQYRATDAFYERLGALRQKVQRHRRLARIAFDPADEGYRVLNLGQTRQSAYKDFMHQASEFYGVLKDRRDLLDRLARFSITDAVADAVLDDITALRAAKTVQLGEMSEAQEATEARDTAVAELRGRVSDFLEVVRIATQDRPQLREALGIVVPR